MQKYRENKIDRVRELAMQVLQKVHVEDAYANVALAETLREVRLPERDRRFLTELVYGVTKAGETLDYMIGRYVADLRKAQPAIRELLRLGFYQIFLMDRVPPSAACDTAVELAKKHGRRGADSFVNGVLRTALREPERAALPDGRNAHALALRTWHPKWLVERWVRAYGYERTEALCRCNNTSAPLSVRVNTLRTNRPALLEQFAAAGAEARASALVPEGILLRAHGALDELAPLRMGLAQVQDESSMLVAHVLAPEPGMTVIDVCAAPGGKTTHIAQRMENRGRILAFDIYEEKIRRIERNAQRLGISIIEAEVRDARTIGAAYTGQADRVLVDAPCSGLGVLRRKPDARWKKRAGDQKTLPPLQRSILASAAEAVKKGGILVYSTCTMEACENAAIVENFLRTHTDFVLEETGGFLPVQKTTERMVQIMPETDGPDGFFIARMRRL